MTKRLLFYYSIFNIGGAERSNLKLMQALLAQGYQVDLLLVTRGGNYEQEIDTRINVSYLRSGNFGTKWKESVGVKKYYYLLRYLLTIIEESIKKIFWRNRAEYDAVFIGLHGLSPAFCLKHVKAKKYFQFIRSDLSKADLYKKAETNIKKYGDKIDYFICVSETALISFNNIFPTLSHKTHKIYNILESEVIVSKSLIDELEENVFKNNVFKILTVCRLQEKSKGILRMMEVLSILTKKGYSIHWYIIGEGMDKKLLEEKIKEEDLLANVSLLGGKSNPYPYFKKVDLIAVLSYYEGLCGVVNETKILEKPIIATEFSGVYEQIQSGKNGLIVKNDLQSIVEGLEYLIQNPNIIKSFAINMLPDELQNDEYKVNTIKKLIKE